MSNKSFCCECVAGGRDFLPVVVVSLVILTHCISISSTLNPVCCVKLGRACFSSYFLQRWYHRGLSWLRPQPRLVFVVSTSARVQPPRILRCPLLLPTCLPIEPVALTTDRHLCLRRFPWRRDREGSPNPPRLHHHLWMQKSNSSGSRTNPFVSLSGFSALLHVWSSGSMLLIWTQV